MVEIIAGLSFYFFAALMVIFSLMVVTLRNPVHSVLSLIMVFFNAAALFVLISAEFLAMTVIIVYVGAVAVLFLFVVMMLDINLAEIRKNFYKNIYFATFIGVVLFIDLFVMFNRSYTKAMSSNFFYHPHLPNSKTNIRQIGDILYTDYSVPFQLAGIILLVAMIGSILLTLRSREKVKRQNIANQLSRTKKDSVRLVKVQIGEGADVGD